MQPFAPKQLEFITNATRKWNLAHGSVRTGKTVCATFVFMQQAFLCPDSRIYIVGHTFDTAYRNVIRLILDSPEMSVFRPFCTWSGKKLYYHDKQIIVLGAKDEGALGAFQGDTYSLVYCDEMTLYPQSIIEMINSRLSQPWSKGYATMNPKQPTHILKQWIDEAAKGDPNYYALHFMLDDNPYVDENYKEMLRKSSSGLFYKRNYLGLWCLAEGAIFDFFEYNLHVCSRPPAPADYWIASIDYGMSNPFVCLLIGVSTGRQTQTGKKLWVEKEYYWDPKVRHRAKTNSELADDIQAMLEPYSIKGIYIDPSAASFKVELGKRGIHCIDANNDVLEGITMTTSEMRKGNLMICSECKNTIKEIEAYVWDPSAAKKGWDEPLKQDDHAMDALRYAIATHKVSVYEPYKQNQNHSQNWGNRFGQRNF
jgi:PBSX family phage terminase large subunit